ncbi:MAG: hypothetical protein HC927_10135 [Deltaproteobacteria bacterium]|nr:hypothetical protein [Deltaproteobacteria bacterium]
MPSKIPDIRGGGSSGVLGGQAGGQKGGIPGVPGIFTTPTKPLPPRPSGELVQKKPLASVMAQATYSPDPDAKLLQATKAARFDKRPGKNTTSFCIDTRGKVVDVKTKAKFPGDPQVDRIIADTVRKWRFTPFEVGGKPVKTCTERTFSISFR